MALTTKIREYREAQGLKQSDLADLVGVRRETIVNLERGRYNPSLKLAMDIAKVFHITEEELFSYTEQENAAVSRSSIAARELLPRRIQKREYVGLSNILDSELDRRKPTERSHG